ncbi:MAG: SCO family protein [Pirellulaceae bacterium]|nr:SCO family protein [Pirellulaceae bacterium]
MLIAGLAMQVGCPSGRRDEGVAAIAYVEDENGKLVPADQYQRRGISQPPRRPAGSDQEWLSQFELTDIHGKSVSSHDLKGQPYVLSFFFTVCPTICPRQNEKLKLLQQQFRGQPFRLVSITCDPDVDQPPVLAEYAKQYGADPAQWYFLTGDLTYIRRVGAEMYFLPVDRRFHADKLLLVDADGQIYGSYEWPEEPAWQGLIDDIQAMLAAGGRLPLKQSEPQSLTAGGAADTDVEAETDENAREE